MIQQHAQQKPISHEAFTIIRGLLSDQKCSLATPSLVNTAWIVAKVSLWNCQQFSSLECEQAKGHISRFFHKFSNPRKAFLVFCQRIFLARNFLELDKMPELSILPSSFFDRKHKHGFSLTRCLYQDVRSIRERIPGYEREMKALAEAVLAYSESPSRKNFQYWTGYFVERDKPELLNLFQLFASNFLHSK